MAVLDLAPGNGWAGSFSSGAAWLHQVCIGLTSLMKALVSFENGFSWFHDRPNCRCKARSAMRSEHSLPSSSSHHGHVGNDREPETGHDRVFDGAGVTQFDHRLQRDAGGAQLVVLLPLALAVGSTEGQLGERIQLDDPGSASGWSAGRPRSVHPADRLEGQDVNWWNWPPRRPGRHQAGCVDLVDDRRPGSTLSDSLASGRGPEAGQDSGRKYTLATMLAPICRRPASTSLSSSSSRRIWPAGRRCPAPARAIRPGSVRVMVLPLRSNRRMRSALSKAPIWAPDRRRGQVQPCAAREKLLSRATVWKARSCDSVVIVKCLLAVWVLAVISRFIIETR